MSLTYGSQVVNGQLISTYTDSAFEPGDAYSPYFSGNGARPATLPGDIQSGSSLRVTRGSNSAQLGGGAVSTTPDGAIAWTSSALAHPWSPTQSPLIWAIIAAVAGVAFLVFVTYRK